jgi:uncharacterized protein (TIGR03435 family)
MLCEPFALNEVVHEMTACRFVQTSYPYLSASAVLVLSGLAQSPGAAAAHPQFEVTSIKPNTSATGTMKFPFPSGGRFTATNLTLKILISFAYKVQGFEVSGGPGWIGSDRYDVTARAADTNIGVEQYRLMLQALLADRFKLAVHRETKEMPVYALLPGKGGPRLPEADPKGCVTSGQSSLPACGGFFTGPSSLDGRKMAMPQFVDALSIVLGRRVIDKTGFTGTFDIHLEFSPEGTALDRRGPGDAGSPVNAGNPDTSRPSIFTAVQEQLGLKLESQKAPAEVLVIDHVERVPTEN